MKVTKTMRVDLAEFAINDKEQIEFGVTDGYCKSAFLCVNSHGEIRYAERGSGRYMDSGLRVDFDTMTVTREAQTPTPTPTPLRDLGELAFAVRNIVTTTRDGDTGKKWCAAKVESADVAENAELAKEKERRIKWQDFVYHAMTRIDSALGRKASEGTGTIEADFKPSCDELCAELARLRAENATLAQEREAMREDLEHVRESHDDICSQAEIDRKENDRLKAEVAALRPVVEAAVPWRHNRMTDAFDYTPPTSDLIKAVDAYLARQGVKP